MPPNVAKTALLERGVHGVAAPVPKDERNRVDTVGVLKGQANLGPILHFRVKPFEALLFLWMVQHRVLRVLGHRDEWSSFAQIEVRHACHADKVCVCLCIVEQVHRRHDVEMRRGHEFRKVPGNRRYRHATVVYRETALNAERRAQPPRPRNVNHFPRGVKPVYRGTLVREELC